MYSGIITDSPKIVKTIDNYKINTVSEINTISKEMLLEMLQLEDYIRMSIDYSNKCTLLKDEVNGWLRLSREIQQGIAIKFGFNDQFTNLFAVNYMRRGHLIYPNDDRFKEVSVYVRNNIARKGEFKLGDSVKDVPFICLDKGLITLNSLVNTPKYTILMGSSET
jgi:hypothetical protein